MRMQWCCQWKLPLFTPLQMAAQQIRAQPARAADQSAAKDTMFKTTAMSSTRLPAAIQIWEALRSFCFMAAMAAIKDKVPNKILTISKAILIVKILSIMTVAVVYTICLSK